MYYAFAFAVSVKYRLLDCFQWVSWDLVIKTLINKPLLQCIIVVLRNYYNERPSSRAELRQAAQRIE